MTFNSKFYLFLTALFMLLPSLLNAETHPPVHKENGEEVYVPPKETAKPTDNKNDSKKEVPKEKPSSKTNDHRTSAPEKDSKNKE